MICGVDVFSRCIKIINCNRDNTIKLKVMKANITINVTKEQKYPVKETSSDTIIGSKIF